VESHVQAIGFEANDGPPTGHFCFRDNFFLCSVNDLLFSSLLLRNHAQTCLSLYRNQVWVLVSLRLRRKGAHLSQSLFETDQANQASAMVAPKLTGIAQVQVIRYGLSEELISSYFLPLTISIRKKAKKV